MPRSFDISVDYEGSVEQVHRAFGDEQYWLTRLADSGVDDASLDSMQIGADGGIAVATTQVLRSDRLPGVVAQFHKGDLRIERRETWSPVTGGQASATRHHRRGDARTQPLGVGLVAGYANPPPRSSLWRGVYACTTSVFT